ncbi:MAG: hypothetical protein E7434_06155 [Ruminococcaceae bacterium]|nr:hypothetical protein [Oscillospiraceae bacterium]
MKIKKKRFLSVLLLAAMLVGLFPMNIFAQESTAASRAATAVAAADPVEIVLDYAKAVVIPKNHIYGNIECASGTSVVGMLGIVSSGTHGTIVNSVSNVYCQATGDTYTAKYGTFTRVTAGLSYQPSKFIDNVETVYIIYKLNSGGTAQYLYIELRLIPGTSVYYETNFSDTAFEKYSTDGAHYFDADNSFYADFTNTELDQKRYEKSVYGGKNYDLGENWNALPTDPDTLIDAYTAPWVENGALSVDFADYSSLRNWIWVQANGDLQTGFTLNYHPHETYVVQARVKFHDLAAVDGEKPYMKVYYFTGIDRWEGSTEDYGDRYKEKLYGFPDAYWLTDTQVAALDTNEYITITFPLGKTQEDTHTLLTNLRFQFGNVNSASTDVMGGFTFDYIYVGPEHSAPENQALYFDFGGTNEDLNHYGTHNYLSQNFDLVSAWGSTTADRIESIAVDEENSALVYTSKYNTEQPNFTIYNPKPLHYTPVNAEVFQIRFKLNNYVSGSTQNWLKLSYWAYGDSSWVADVATKQFPASCLNSDEFVTLQMELPDSFRSVADLKTLRLQVTGLKSTSETELGMLTIDYIYIGSKEKAPTEIERNDYLLFDFTNSEVARTRYVNNPSYGGFNYDIANWATERTSSTKAYTLNHANGTISVAVKDVDSDWGPYFATTNTNGAYPWGESGKGYAPLSYPITPDTVLKIRFKVSGCSVPDGQTPYVALLLHNTDSTGTKQYSQSIYTTYTYKADEYIDLTFNLSNGLTGTEILNSVGLRFRQIDGTGTNPAVTIDYIYVGPSEIIPAKNESGNLYFDFGNTSVDQARYENDSVYGGKNYDLASNWSTYSQYYTAPEIDNANGTMRFGFANNTRKYLWCQANSDPQYNFTLSYRPESDHYIYMRLRFNDMVASGSPYIKIIYYIGKDIFEGNANSNERPYELDAYSITAEQVSSGEFVTLKIPITRTNGTVHSKWTNFRLMVSHITSASTEKLGTIDVDYIYFGASSPAPTSEASGDCLYFDFKNSEVDCYRYATDPVYAGKNFDTGNWRTEFYDNGVTSTVSHAIDNVVGTISCDVTNQASAVKFVAPGISFDTKNAEVVKVRFKIENMKANPNATSTPFVRLWYSGKYNSNTYQFDKDFASDGSFITITTPVDSAFRTAGTITQINITFHDLILDDTTKNGRITIDYIYVGTEADFSKVRGENKQVWQTITDGTTADNNQGNDIKSLDNALFFDFSDTPTDRIRYRGAQYGGQSFDVSSAWASRNSYAKSFTVNPEDSSLLVGLNSSKASFTVSTGLPLSYDLSNAEIFEVRFKMEGLKKNASYSAPFIELVFKSDTLSSWTVATTKNFFPVEYLSNGEYLVFQLECESFTDDFKNSGTLTALDCFFRWLDTGTSGLATIDYFYLGPKATAPSSTTYGYDSSYEDDSKLSNGSSLYVEGQGIPLMRTNKSINYDHAFSETAFTFTGTGFDIISRTGADQGQLRAVVYDARGNFVKVAQVLNKSDLGTELMQIPVLSVEIKDATTQEPLHGTYYVKIFTAAPYDYGNNGNNDAFEGALDRGGEFCFDAVRIYNPINVAANTSDAQTAYEIYQKHGEADPSYMELRNKLISEGYGDISGSAVYIDAKTDADYFKDKLPLALYTEVGPNNEVYLENGKAIAFKLTAEGSLPSGIDIAAKSANGTAVKLVTKITSSAPSAVPTETDIENGISIESATQLYYPLNIDATAWQSSNTEKFVYVTIYNAGDGILSIADIKSAYDSANTSAVRTLRASVDRETLDALNICYEHAYVYSENGDQHIAQCASCGYQFTEAHAYTDGICSCGGREIQTSEALDFTMNITVGAEMNVAYSIMASTVNTYTDFYLEISKAVAGGEAIVTTYNVEDFETSNDPESGEVLMYKAIYKGINAKEMGDEFTTTLYAVDADGKIYCGPTQTASIKSTLLEKLGSENASDELKTMAIDMLNYGAAAQVRLGYNTENLVTADLTEEQLAYATAELPEAVNNAASTGTGANVNTNITVTSRVQLNLSCIYTTAADPNAVKCVITDSEGSVLAEIAATSKGNIMFSAIYENVGAKQMRDVINATFCEGENAISQTISWSVESYVAQVRAKTNVAEDELNMVNAMLTYGDSVAAYMEAK